MEQIKAILFDMDGVLIDARDWHFEALNEALQLFGTAISRYDHLESFDGLPTKAKLKKLSLLENLPQGLHSFINDLKQKFTMQHIYKKCCPLYTHQYALSALKAMGYKIGVCSNSIRDSIDTMMQLSGLKPYLDNFWSAEDVKEGKPNPEIYTQAIQYFGLLPEEVVILEDNENGIKAAQAAGAHCMIVEDVSQVNFENISGFINKIELGNTVVS